MAEGGWVDEGLDSKYRGGEGEGEGSVDGEEWFAWPRVRCFMSMIDIHRSCMSDETGVEHEEGSF